MSSPTRDLCGCGTCCFLLLLMGPGANMRKTYFVYVFVLLFLPNVARAQSPIRYRLQYAAPGDCCVHVQLVFAEPLPAPITLVMPRTYPGGYEQILYDAYVDKISAFDSAGKAIGVIRDEGPRWNAGKAGETVERIEYQIDVARMESQILSSVEASKVRPGYVGLLGYSIFAFVDGLEDRPINLVVNVPEGWPVLTTLAPKVPAPTTTTHAEAPDYYSLADSQILIGPELQLRRFEGKIPLILAVYSEAAVDLDAEGALAHQALEEVQAYFGDTPIPQYTVQLEFFKPLPGHDYNFSQEHVNSGTFSFSLDRRLNTPLTRERRESILGNYAHHIAHSWIPKRAYGTGYRPFTWELAPVIDTIWFNEGFGRYAGIEAVANGMAPAEAAAFRDGQLSRLRKILDSAPVFIKKMPLDVLSREASFLYALDFRTGKNIFARGALMAAEMDDRIRAKTNGEKSLRDALRALLAWSEKNHRAFQLEEMMQVFTQATGVDVRDILKRWQEPPTK
jgi:predicted metalloprotease with PDZ domain